MVIRLLQYEFDILHDLLLPFDGLTDMLFVEVFVVAEWWRCDVEIAVHGLASAFERELQLTRAPRGNLEEYDTQ